MRKLALGVAGLCAVLAGCGETTPPGNAYLGMKPELRTNYIDIATDRYVACDKSYASIPFRQNIVVVEFSAPGIPDLASADVEVIGEKTGDKTFAMDSELRKSSRGNYIADVVFYERLVPASLGALNIQPQYQYVSLTSRPRGSFKAQLTIDTPNGPETATTDSVNVYDSCAYLNNTEPRD
ncbi:hypothetical protein [Deinococcus apachensis]|uniref:hypothetical protein n=1 Tax=Deinococcus apachensis TaxID=309886 RepID=UPI0006872E6D|nr:hypothetical protein [Deinococcus apachensis]